MLKKSADSLQEKQSDYSDLNGWGDGEWMRTWEETCKADGAVLACESVLANEAPDDNAVAACQALGKALC